jgi:hypothetical protein
MKEGDNDRLSEKELGSVKVTEASNRFSSTWRNKTALAFAGFSLTVGGGLLRYAYMESGKTDFDPDYVNALNTVGALNIFAGGISAYVFAERNNLLLFRSEKLKQA